MEKLQCYCGSALSYLDCCQPFHHHLAVPTTPEALMRSRYSAYRLANIAYIQETMQGKAAYQFDPIVAKQWAEQVIWIGLNVVGASMNTPIEGQVEFIAHFFDEKMYHRMHEISLFKYDKGRWYYVDGQQITHPAQALSRNATCPCGSKKKWKQCHGKALF